MYEQTSRLHLLDAEVELDEDDDVLGVDFDFFAACVVLPPCRRRLPATLRETTRTDSAASAR